MAQQLHFPALMSKHMCARALGAEITSACELGSVWDTNSTLVEQWVLLTSESLLQPQPLHTKIFMSLKFLFLFMVLGIESRTLYKTVKI